MKVSNLICDNCEFEIESDSDFCPRCGMIIIDEVLCDNHSSLEAKGACVVCGKAFCGACGYTVNQVFLCNEHNSYEIYEGMARVFGSSDVIQCEFVKSCLAENQLHPFIYSRKSSPMHLGGTDYSMFRADGDFNGHILNEIKVLVPCSEVLEAEKVISELDLKSN